MYSLSSMEEGYAHGEYTVQFGVYHITCVHNDRTKTNKGLTVYVYAKEYYYKAMAIKDELYILWQINTCNDLFTFLLCLYKMLLNVDRCKVAKSMYKNNDFFTILGKQIFYFSDSFVVV